MFNWITGPRITNAIEDVHTDPAYESTFIEAPETPAHQFAVKAFKHALFGTPAPEEANNPTKKLEKKTKLDLANAKPAEIPAPKEIAPAMSPSKQPGGILLTPGTVGKGRKTVSFGSQVVDNEAKPGNVGKSGIPNDCPGKFPSPWTPGTHLKPNVESDKKPRTKLTEALMDARSSTKPSKSTQKPKAKDDIDITLDLSAPRSESGKFWKERYEQYAESSEKEMKKIVAKQQLAKNYAKKKDAEVTELLTRLEQERKRFKRREQELEQQNKDYQERLRQTRGENASANIEVAALKARVAVLEKSIVEPSSEMHNSRGAFHIYEDASKEAIQPHFDPEKAPELSFAPSVSMASSGKENSPPKLRHMRRQTLPNSASRPTSSHAPRSKLGTDAGEVSILFGKSPRASTKPSDPLEKPSLAPPFVESAQNSLQSAHKPESRKQNMLPKSPAVAGLRSSPLPLPTPEADPWMGVADMEESHIPQMDRMALPISSGPSYSKPTRPNQSRQPNHRASKSVPHTALTTEAPRSRRQNEKSVLNDEQVEDPWPVRHSIKEHISRGANVEEAKFVSRPKENPLLVDTHTTPLSPADPKFDLSKITGHHAEGSSKVTKDRAEMPIDRKAEARKRLEARKKVKKDGAS